MPVLGSCAVPSTSARQDDTLAPVSTAVPGGLAALRPAFPDDPPVQALVDGFGFPEIQGLASGTTSGEVFLRTLQEEWDEHHE